MAKLEELQRQRQERKKALEEGEEDISNFVVLYSFVLKEVIPPQKLSQVSQNVCNQSFYD
jgi:hypothetical protein